MTEATQMKATPESDATNAFFAEFPEAAQQISEESAKGNFDAGFTPAIIEVKFFGLTFLRYENGKLTATRECSKGYVPPFWEICFDEEETALFVLGNGKVLLDRTGDMAALDLLLEQCNFLGQPGSQVLTTRYS
ncbi:MAG: hypothetical protein WBA76_21330 [Phormidesmis sp.]